MKRLFFLIFSVALIVRIISLFSFNTEASLLYRDSLTYIQAAKNMLAHGTYSIGYTLPPTPDSFRTPLYPLLLIPFVKFGISWYVLAAIQAVAMSFAAGFAFLLGRNLFSERIAFWGAMFFAVEPFSALIGNQIMTEAFFSLLFITALYSFALYTRDVQAKHLIGGACALAFAALLKQFALFFGIFIPVAFFMSGARPRQWKIFIAALAVFVGVLSPWLIRNRVTLHTWGFSSQSGYNLYAYNAQGFSLWLERFFPDVIAKRGVTLESDDLLDVNVKYDLSRISEIQAKAVKFISSYPFMYAMFHILHTPLLFTNSGYNNLFYAIPKLGFRYEDEQALYDDIGVFRFTIAAGRIAAHPVLLFALIANLFFLLVAFFALISPLLERRKTGRAQTTTALLVIAVLFYALLSSPISGARLRIPLNPILFMLALHSAALLRAPRFAEEKAPAPALQ